ncbi:MAG: hypothetical protein ABSG67_21420, partial [Thermoguttaceae bacterium]
MSKSNKFSNKRFALTRPVSSNPSAPPLSLLAGIAIIVFAVFIAYIPSISGGFIWDDELLITQNRLIKVSD